MKNVIQIKVGDELPNGATVLKINPVEYMRVARGDGEVIYKQRYVLCLFRGGFVTWNIQSNDPSSTCHGNYHTDLREALDCFENRIHPVDLMLSAHNENGWTA